jgi:hypothetical protein
MPPLAGSYGVNAAVHHYFHYFSSLAGTYNVAKDEEKYKEDLLHSFSANGASCTYPKYKPTYPECLYTYPEFIFDKHFKVMSPLFMDMYTTIKNILNSVTHILNCAELLIS